MITFITGNDDKFREVADMLAPIPLVKKKLDLPEIQSIDGEEIIREKLSVAQAHAPGEYIVEDTSLYFDCLGGKLPGPLVKWFEKAIQNEGLADLVLKYGDNGALMRCLVGYSDPNGSVKFFTGDIRVKIVTPRGEKGWGLDPILEVNGKTYGEMEHAEKHLISNRGIAMRRLKDFLLEKAVM